VQYHSQDIVAIRAKVKYTTLIELPTTDRSAIVAASGPTQFVPASVIT
jgi:type IV secretion system protein VirB9